MSDEGSSGKVIDPSELFDSDPDREVILARRRLFVLVAVTGLATVPACGGRVQYDGTSISTGGTAELNAGGAGGALQGMGGTAAFPTTLLATGGSNTIGNASATGGNTPNTGGAGGTSYASGGSAQSGGTNTSGWGGSSFTSVGGWASVGGTSFDESTGGAVSCAGCGCVNY